jgi:hypothetical protein
MQEELDDARTARPVRLLGVNGIDLESDNALVVEGRTLPWLQDTRDAQVWGSWDVVYRDVVVLDVDNRRVFTFNLTSNDLGDAGRYAELKDLLLRLGNGDPVGEDG